MDDRDVSMDIKKSFNELSVLAPLLTIYTLAYLALMGLDFAAKGEFDMPVGLMAVYFALLLAYATDKEIRRWTGKEAPPRKGTLFVYFWLIFYLVVFIIHSLKPDYALPNDLTTVTLQVLGIFFGSKVSKKIFQARAQKLVDAVLEKVVPSTGISSTETAIPQGNKPATANTETPKSDSPITPVTTSATVTSVDRDDGRESKEEEIVLNVIHEKGQAKREDLLSATGMSKSSLGRLLDKMEEKGLITQIGDRKTSHYVLGKPTGGT